MDLQVRKIRKEEEKKIIKHEQIIQFQATIYNKWRTNNVILRLHICRFCFCFVVTLSTWKIIL